MGAFPTVLLAIVLIFAAGLIKLVIALMRKNPAAAKERVPFMLALPALYPACPCCAGSPKRPQRPAERSVFAAVERSNAGKIVRCLMRGANLNDVKSFTVN